MADVYVWSGELREGWSMSQPHAPADNEKTEVARQALESKGRAMIDQWNTAPLPQKFVFDNVRLTSIDGEWSETHHDPITGVSSWDGGGVAVGKLYYRLTGSIPAGPGAAPTAKIVRRPDFMEAV